MDGNGLRSLLSNSITSALQAVQFSDTTTLWKYITLAFNGIIVKTYINGVLKTTATQTVIPNNGLFKFLLCNTNGEDYVINANVSQMKIYNEMRSDSQIITDYNEFKARYGY